MTLSAYYLQRSEYKGKLEKVIGKISGNTNMIQSSRSYEQAYFINATEALFYYDGKNTIVIGARNMDGVERTRSRVERMGKVELTPIPLPKRYNG